MNRFWQSGLALLLWWQVALSQAQLPITIQDIFLRQNTKELGISLQYASQQSDGGFYLDPDGVFFVRDLGNVDQLTLGLSARFGASENTELSLDASTTHSDSRNINNFVGRRSGSEWHGPSVGFGFSHRVSNDAETPGLQVFGRVSLLERSSNLDSDHVYGKNLSTGLVVYRTRDPVLLSASLNLSYARGRKVRGFEEDQGYSASLSARLSFFVNSAVTLAAGFSVRWSDKVQRDGMALGINETRTAISYGLGYTISDSSSLHMHADVDATRDSGASFRLELVHRM